MRFDLVLQARSRQGWARVRRALVPVLLASVAAGLAFAIARYGLGHAFPFFAPASAWIALGFTADRQPRRVAELAIGVAVGVGAGDLFVHIIGAGAVQVAVVLFIAVLLARFIDRGDLLAVQAGVQAVVIVVLPATSSGGAVNRWLDAVVGGVLALIVAVLSPQDPRRRVRSLAAEGMREISSVLEVLAGGLGSRRTEEIDEALVRGRASQPVLDQWRSAAVASRDAARVSPAFRKHLPALGELEAAAVLADRAMRNLRVLVRRARAVVAQTGTPELEAALDSLAAIVVDLRICADDLGAALAGSGSPEKVRERLAEVARRTDPRVVAPQDWHVQSLVMLVRSLVVDLEEAAGVEPGQARAWLPEL
ncbi:FUSC family protein [Actinotalea sp.]|uniref:FUSC family protein n=1 Tax=Actinotalea sp. TaxID=1872145 RepID=UPI00356B1892